MTKFYQTLNQAPRSYKHHGKYRTPSAPVYRSSTRQSGKSLAGRGNFLAGAPVAFIGADYCAEPRPIENAGIRAGEVIALRGWRVVDGLLHSLVKRSCKWVPGEPASGDVRTEYGVHAFKNASDLSQYLFMTALWSKMDFLWGNDGPEKAPPSVFATGTVAMWGEVIEHEFGYRAEFAKVASIDNITGGSEDQLRELRTKYNVQHFGS